MTWAMVLVELSFQNNNDFVSKPVKHAMWKPAILVYSGCLPHTKSKRKTVEFSPKTHE